MFQFVRMPLVIGGITTAVVLSGIGSSSGTGQLGSTLVPAANLQSWMMNDPVRSMGITIQTPPESTLSLTSKLFPATPNLGSVRLPLSAVYDNPTLVTQALPSPSPSVSVKDPSDDLRFTPPSPVPSPTTATTTVQALW
ncbi:MAG: hypothetical protein LVT47_01870 [Cyanobacteria bacterium LVE1205-1]